MLAGKAEESTACHGTDAMKIVGCLCDKSFRGPACELQVTLNIIVISANNANMECSNCSGMSIWGTPAVDGLCAAGGGGGGGPWVLEAPRNSLGAAAPLGWWPQAVDRVEAAAGKSAR